MKRIYFLFIVSIFSLNLYCQSLWTKHPGNPVMLPGSVGEWDEGDIFPGCVVYHTNIYHMWYIGGPTILTRRTGHATSPDGITWTKDPSNPVLTVGSPGSWDETMIQGGGVVVINNTFHMWYTGCRGGAANYDWQTGHATSPDGITWTKDPNNPVLPKGGYGDWDAAAAVAGSVLYDGTKYHIWYFGAVGTSYVQIGHATSPDGLTWTKDPSNPVLTVGPIGSWDIPRVENPSVVFDGTTYHMWYNGGQIFNVKVGYAKSVDGSKWMKYPSNPVLITGQTGSWDSRFVANCTVIDTGGAKYKMWYSGGKSANGGSIGYAESDARIPYLFVKNKTFVGKTDTLAAEINKDGIIYIVPEGTSLVNDSIIKYKVASVDTIANAEVQIPLKDLSYGQYMVVAVSKAEFVSPDPFLLKVVPDATVPVLTLAEDTVTSGDPISVTSSKDGTVYLFNAALPPDLSLIRNPNFLIDSLSATANVPREFSTTGLNVNNNYYLYVVDIYGMFSERGTVSVEPLVGVKENTNEGIRIYPNPANDLLIIETDIIGQHSIEITSINGQLIYSTMMEGNFKQIDLSSFQKGVYFITIRSKDFLRTEKIIRL